MANKNTPSDLGFRPFASSDGKAFSFPTASPFSPSRHSPQPLGESANAISGPWGCQYERICMSSHAGFSWRSRWGNGTEARLALLSTGPVRLPDYLGHPLVLGLKVLLERYVPSWTLWVQTTAGPLHHEQQKETSHENEGTDEEGGADRADY